MLRILTVVILISLFLAGCGAALTQIASVAPTMIPTSTTFPTPTVAPTPVPGTLFVDPSISLGSISRLIYGSNYGPWLTVPFYMLPQAYDSGIKIRRFPGGEWGDHKIMVINLSLEEKTKAIRIGDQAQV
jgi:hypothetical protein